MSADCPLIHVIDDDPSIRTALDSLLRAVGFDARVYESTKAFLSSERPDRASCIVLDVKMPGQDGLAFQKDWTDTNGQIPIVFITGHGDIPMSVRAMKGGAIEFLTKPFRDEDLLDAIGRGIRIDRARREEETRLATFHARFESLTPREKQVFERVVSGRLNKQIAVDLGLSEITVKVCRGHMMRKMQAASLADLVRMADRLGLPRWDADSDIADPKRI